MHRRRCFSGASFFPLARVDWNWVKQLDASQFYFLDRHRRVYLSITLWLLDVLGKNESFTDFRFVSFHAVNPHSDLCASSEHTRSESSILMMCKMWNSENLSESNSRNESRLFSGRKFEWFQRKHAFGDAINRSSHSDHRKSSIQSTPLSNCIALAMNARNEKTKIKL